MAKILIIDDDLSIRDLLSRALRRQGHEVATAADGATGLTAALKQPDLIICDFDMPGLNGHGVLAALRQSRGLESVPFIFFSGRANRQQVRQSMNMGGDDFIAKPAELSEILDTVNARLLLRQHQQQRQADELKKAVQIFSGITNDLGSSTAAIQWLADAALADKAPDKHSLNQSRKDGGESSRLPATTGLAPDSFLAVKDNRRYFVKLSEIKILMADGEYSKAFWGDGQNMMFRKPLKQWEIELPAPQFIRIHRKAIINLAHLDSVVRTASGKFEVHIKDFKATVEVSERKVPLLNQSLKACHLLR